MGRSESAIQDRPVMSASPDTEDDGVTRWDHVKTFALVGVRFRGKTDCQAC